jgi:hypothetical protein
MADRHGGKVANIDKLVGTEAFGNHFQSIADSLLCQYQNQYQETLAQLGDAEKRSSHELARVEAMIVEQEQELARGQQNKQRILAQLVEARATSTIKRFFKGIKTGDLELKVARTGQVVADLEQSLQDLKYRRSDGYQHLKAYRRQRQALATALEEIQRALHTLTDEAQRIDLLKEQVQAQRQSLAQIEARLKQRAQRYQGMYNACLEKRSHSKAQIAEIDKRLRDLEKGIAEQARVAGTTLTKVYMNQAMVSKRFDAVILEEVSMASLPLVYIAAAHADRSVTLIGDPQQLAPIVNAQTPLAARWLGTDLFRFRGISLAAAIQEKEHSVILDVQSRMHPSISVIVRRWVYGEILKGEFSNGLKIAPLPGSPLVLCDTQDASPIVTRPANGRSRKNCYHALCRLALARRILASVPEMKQRAERSIGIVTPYRPQAQLLQKLIKDDGLQNWVQAGTVHRFQGLEFDAVIFDTVESPGLAPGEFIAGSKGSDSMRLVNVAVTRPKQKLYIVANLPYLRQMLYDQATLRQAAEEAASAAVLPSLEIAATPFSTFLEKLCRLEPDSDHMRAALAGALLSETSQDMYKRLHIRYTCFPICGDTGLREIR